MIHLRYKESGQYEVLVKLIDNRIVPLIDHDTQAPQLVTKNEVHGYGYNRMSRLYHMARMMEKHPK